MIKSKLSFKAFPQIIHQSKSEKLLKYIFKIFPSEILNALNLILHNLFS